MRSKIRRPSHATVVAYIALFLALGGVGYAALKLPANSVGTKQIKDKAVTLAKISHSARTALQGAAGAPCLPANPACRGPQGTPGPGAISIHVDTTHPFADTALASVGPWTIHAACTDNGTTTEMQVRAEGPVDSVADGLAITGTAPYDFSDTGSKLHLGNDFSFPHTSTAVDTVSLDLFSDSSGGAHISLFRYETGSGTGSGFRCKISGTAYPTLARR
jgi:hypothetical protein